MSPPLWWRMRWLGALILTLPMIHRHGTGGKPVYLRDIWPTQKEVQDAVSQSIIPACHTNYQTIFEGDQEWKRLAVPEGETYVWTMIPLT